MSDSWWERSCVRRKIRKGIRGFLLSILLLGTVSQQGSSEFVYKKSGRDPFWPLVTEEGKLIQGFGGESLENVYLEGIIWDAGGDSVAMINGMILRQGEQIGGIKILKIGKDYVTLQTEEGVRLLRLEGLD